MIEIAGDMLSHAAVKLRRFIFLEKRKILVCAVYKAHGKLLLSYLFEKLLLFFRAVPYKAEISADKQYVALFELFDFGRRETFIISVGISRNIKHKTVLLENLSIVYLFYRSKLV